MKISSRLLVTTVVFLCSFAQQTIFAQGVLLRSVGAVNASVCGTATAMPLDASGAIMWNPASISALPKNEMTFGLELLDATSHVESRMGSLYGSTNDQAGVIPAPTMAFVWSNSRRSPFTFGLGMGAIGGAASLFPHDRSNPVLGHPALSNYLGDHGRSANVIILQVTPTVSLQLTERLSVGAAPIVDLASLNINPMSLGSHPMNPLMTYGTKYFWGGGFQVGAYYDFQNHFKAGFMFKSPIWAEKLYFTGTDSNDEPANAYFKLNLPMTLSAGISYDGIRNTIIGVDVRYIDYANSTGFKESSPNIVDGLDWESVFAVCIGMERKICHRLKGRVGYSWNENPIPNRSAFTSISAPMIMQHIFSCGFSWAIVKDLEVSAAYCHAFEMKSTGPLPAGIPGTVTNVIAVNSILAGITKKW